MLSPSQNILRKFCQTVRTFISPKQAFFSSTLTSFKKSFAHQNFYYIISWPGFFAERKTTYLVHPFLISIIPFESKLCLLRFLFFHKISIDHIQYLAWYLMNSTVKLFCPNYISEAIVYPQHIKKEAIIPTKLNVLKIWFVPVCVFFVVFFLSSTALYQWPTCAVLKDTENG